MLTAARRFALPASLAYLWVMMILLGALALQTFMIYPNIFHDPPASLAAAMAFMSEAAPSDFFPPLGFLSCVTGAAALALAWPNATARRWLLVSLGCIVADGLVSIVFFWPRNDVMFVEGLAVHSAEVLRQAANEFVTLHWLRLALNIASAVAAFAAFTALYRTRIIESAAGRTGATMSDPASTAALG